jgi:hypothetical protein
VLSQSARLVREQIRLQAEFGPLLLLGMGDVVTRERIASANRETVAAIAANDASRARHLVAGEVRDLAAWLLAAKVRIERGGQLDVEAAVHA